MYDTIIIGGGPAGITAGIYTVRKKLNTLLITEDFIGQVGKSFLIENYPGFEEIQGLNLAVKLEKHLKKFKIDIKEREKVIGIKKKNDNSFEVKTTKENNYLAKTIIITSGTNPKHLNVPGEKDFSGKGVSYCVTCDGPLFRDKIVVVVGGGNSGFESALELAKYCPKVYILEFGPQVGADEITQEMAAKEKKIELVTNAVTKEIKGKDFVESIVYENKASKELKELSVQGVFIEIGYIPNSDFVRGLVPLTEYKEIIIDLKTGSTKTAGIFAAGDVTDIKYKQIIIAAGLGAAAGISAYNYIQNLKSNGDKESD